MALTGLGAESELDDRMSTKVGRSSKRSRQGKCANRAHPKCAVEDTVDP